MATSKMPTMAQLLEKPWWSTQDVAAYLTLLRGKACSLNAARIFLWRNKVRRSSIDRRLTSRAFVDAALSRK